MSPISGVVPFFDYSTSPGPDAAAVVTVTGAATGMPNGTHASETLAAFFQRAVNILSRVSGTLTSGEQVVTSGAISGVRNLQRELAFRVGDLTASPDPAKRLAVSQASLAVSGEVAFGS